jgi:hypothetical protein
MELETYIKQVLREHLLTDDYIQLTKEHQKLIERNKRINHSNLTPLQQETLHLLHQNKRLNIKPTNKNLVPALMELETYIKQVLREHLLTDDYIQLTKEEMERIMRNLKTTLQDIITSNQNQLSKAEAT